MNAIPVKKMNHNNKQFSRNNLIFEHFHNSNLFEDLRSKPSTSKEDKKNTVNFNSYMIKQKDYLGHSDFSEIPKNNNNSKNNSKYNLNHLDNNSNNFDNNSNHFDNNSNHFNNNLPKNIYHNFSNYKLKSKNTSFDYNNRNFRINYNK